MPISTRLTERLGLRHPIVLAPMSNAAGGRLAAAVSAAGGLGLIGCGACGTDWIEQEFSNAGNTPVGCGFIIWALQQEPERLHRALAHRPVATMLAFDDPTPYAQAIHDAGSKLICQVQDISMARAAIAAGADIIAAQGTEAGGHGAVRATMTLVPEVADLLARESPDTLLLAAGGIADGRGLAAALMLGADGVLMGSRFWASAECLVHPNLQQAALARNGDGTVRTLVGDIARGSTFPPQFTGRVLRSALIERWLGREDEFRQQADAQRPDFFAALARGDSDATAVHVGEVTGLMDAVRPAAEIVNDVVGQAELLLRDRPTTLVA